MKTVTATRLSRSFGDFIAVDNVSFEVSQGEIFGFLGSNGAGKTTTIRILCGLLAPTSGEAMVAGYDVATDAQNVKKQIGYMSQRFSLYPDLTATENIRFWGAAYGLGREKARQRLKWGLKISGLESQAGSLIRDLPGGFGQRLALVCALLHEPPIVFLDEPTGGVDPEARRAFWDLIDDLSAGGTTVFVTTHYMDEAERCHRVALMHRGILLALDSVPALKDSITSGVIAEIRCARAPAAIRALLEHPAIDDASLFGDSIHAELKTDSTIIDVEAILEKDDFSPFEVRRISPSLEDVFIRAIRDADEMKAS